MPSKSELTSPRYLNNLSIGRAKQIRSTLVQNMAILSMLGKPAPDWLTSALQVLTRNVLATMNRTQSRKLSEEDRALSRNIIHGRPLTRNLVRQLILNMFS